MCSDYNATGEVSTCMECRHGERRLGHRFSVCLIFRFLRVWEYHLSAAVCLRGCTPSELGWEPYEMCCSPL